MGHAGLADTYYILGTNMMVAPDESYPRARAAAQKALELDPGLAEAHTTLAAVLMAYDWEWLASERAFDRAVELKPGYATAHHWRSFLWSALGRHSEAVAAIKRARELDPLSPRINANVGLMLYTARRYDESILELQKVLKLWPDDAATHIYLGQSLVEAGRHAQAIVELERGRELLAGVPAASLRLACARALAGEQQRAREIVEAVVSERTVRHVSATVLAEAYTALGETNQALLWLERAYAEREAELIELAVNPALDPLRSERRFEEILRRMKFPEQTGT